jgi:hypothetical protein
LHHKVLQSTYEDAGHMVFPLSGGKTLVGGNSVNLNGDFAAIPYRGARDVFLAVFGPWDAGVDGMDSMTQEIYNIFPNPARTEVTIETKETSISHQVTLTDIVGRVVLRSALPKGTEHFNLQTATLLPGTYTLSVTPHTGIPYRKVIVIQQ